MKFIKFIYRLIIPKWELVWCASKPMFAGPCGHWSPRQCWTKNGELDSRYAFSFCLECDSKEDAQSMCDSFNEIDRKHNAVEASAEV